MRTLARSVGLVVLFAALTAACSNGVQNGPDASSCPSSDTAASLANTPCSHEGKICHYEDSARPECGNRTLTCTRGTWNEIHTDPSRACFGDAGP
jgi:hypothetical protein